MQNETCESKNTTLSPIDEDTRQALIDMIYMSQEYIDETIDFKSERSRKEAWDRINKARYALANWEKYHGI